MDKYILVWDATFFVVDFFTGDGASDLGHLQSRNVFKLRDQEGYFLRFTLTKNVRTGTPRSFALIQFIHPEVCPVAWVQHYITVCQCLGISLDQRYCILSHRMQWICRKQTLYGFRGQQSFDETPFRVQTPCRGDSA